MARHSADRTKQKYSAHKRSSVFYHADETRQWPASRCLSTLDLQHFRWLENGGESYKARGRVEIRADGTES